MTIGVRVHRTFEDQGKFKAVVSLNLNNCLNIHNVRLIEGKKGYFLSMPDTKRPDGKFRDICYPTNTAFRNELTEAVVFAYEENLRQEVE